MVPGRPRYTNQRPLRTRLRVGKRSYSSQIEYLAGETAGQANYLSQYFDYRARIGVGPILVVPAACWESKQLARIQSSSALPPVGASGIPCLIRIGLPSPTQW